MRSSGYSCWQTAPSRGRLGLLIAIAAPPLVQLALALFAPAPLSGDELLAAQLPGPRGKLPAAGRGQPTTEVEFEILTGDEGVGLKAQRWSSVFQELRVPFSIRRGRPDEKLEITERKIGNVARKVTVVGRLDKQGRLQFADRSFTEADSQRLAAWIKDLQTFGAQGNPSGQPLWGLTKAQFGPLFTALSKPLDDDPVDQPWDKALALFDLPAEYPVRIAPSAAPPARAALCTQSLAGLSKGTALAVLLNEQGLGFRPHRLPQGAVEFEVVPLAEATDVWPIGWPVQTTGPKAAPRYFSITQIDIQDLPLRSVLAAASETLQMPIVEDRHQLQRKSIDTAKVNVSHPPKRTTWSLALKHLTFQAKTRPDLYADEAGKPFLLITLTGAPQRTAVAAEQ